jgi:hypothetical protein
MLMLTNVGPQNVNSPIVLDVRRVLESWTEGDSNPADTASAGETTWAYKSYDAAQWANEGCSAPGSSTTSGEVSKTYSSNPADGTQSVIDVTSIVRHWAGNGEASNHGFVLLAPGQEMSAMNFVRFAASEYPDAALRPRIVIKFSPAGGCGPADKDRDGVVDITEMIVYISEWKSGSVSISSLINAIGKWKDGC